MSPIQDLRVPKKEVLSFYRTQTQPRDHDIVLSHIRTYIIHHLYFTSDLQEKLKKKENIYK